MIRYFRTVLGALQAIAQALRDLCAVGSRLVEDGGPSGGLEERVASIERELQRWEAQVEAELLRAESKFKQARAAEERTRHAAKALEGDEESEEEQLEAWRSYVQASDGGGGDEAGVPPVHAGVADPRSEKARLRAQKLGLL